MNNLTSDCKQSLLGPIPFLVHSFLTVSPWAKHSPQNQDHEAREKGTLVLSPSWTVFMQFSCISISNLGWYYMIIIVNKHFNIDELWFFFFLRAELTLYASHKFDEYSQKQSCLFPSCPLVYFWSSWCPCSPVRKEHVYAYYTSTNIPTRRINHMYSCSAFINFPMARILLPAKISAAISGLRRWIVAQTQYSWSY